jgi:26S proteasome regulatory subunit N3
MDVDTATPAPAAPTKPTPPLELVPESEVYIRLLLIHHLINSEATYKKAMQLAKETVELIGALNRRSMDPIAAKVWYALERAYELGGQLADARP